MKRTFKNMVMTMLCLAFIFSMGIPANAKTKEYETVTFGNFWQEDTNKDGKADRKDKKTPIKWIVLKKYSDGTALVMSKNILYVKAFSTSRKAENYTWEKSDVRSWLNKDFYNSAFSSAEKKAVKIVTNKNDHKDNYGNDDGPVTKDNVFLLSIDEAKNTSFGFSGKESTKDKAKRAKLSEFAKNVYRIESGNTPSGNICWWLRSRGYNSNLRAYVLTDGKIGLGCQISIPVIGVRPAIRVNLKSSNVKKDSKASFSIKDSSKVKISTNIKIKDKDKIRKITLNGKRIKLKSSKTAVTLNLSSYQKKLKGKGVWNTLVMIDEQGNKYSLKFKIK